MYGKILNKFVKRLIPHDRNGEPLPYSEVLLLTAVWVSIILSLIFYFILDNNEAALFVGLWAPTIMSIVNFINLKFKD